MAKNSQISRRKFIEAAASIIPASVAVKKINAMANNEKELRLYIGTYTSGRSKSKGIYLSIFDARSGELTSPQLVAETEEPSFLAISKNAKYLYAVNETLKYDGEDSGAVTAYAIDRSTGGLKFLNKQASRGGAPCHISITEKGDLVLVANYLGGNVAAFPVNKDGSLQPSSDVVQHIGRGPNPDRQEAPHCHSVILDEHDRFAVVDDLGIDKAMIYAVDRKAGKLIDTGNFYSTRPGAGPRHFKFHPNGKFAYLNAELDMTVTSLSWDGNLGKLAEVQTLSTLPANYKQTSKDSIADLHISKDGKILYVSNRGHDSISSFSINERSGEMTLLETIKTNGRTPRNFALDPTGSFLLVANQNSANITIFKIDKDSGKLTLIPKAIPAPAPVCLCFQDQ